MSNHHIYSYLNRFIRMAEIDKKLEKESIIKRITKFILSLNWSSFIFVMLICYIGTMSNANISDIKIAFIFGTIIGIPVALTFAIIGRE